MPSLLCGRTSGASLPVISVLWRQHARGSVLAGAILWGCSVFLGGEDVEGWAAGVGIGDGVDGDGAVDEWGGVNLGVEGVQA